MASANTAPDPKTQTAAQMLDRVDNTLCHLGRTDDRFEIFEELSETVGEQIGSDGIGWKRYVAPETTATDSEAKIAYNIAELLELSEDLPGEVREAVQTQLVTAVDHTDLESADAADTERIKEMLTTDIPVGIGHGTDIEDAYQFVRHQLVEAYDQSRYVEIEVTFSDYRHDPDDIRALVEGEIFDELLSVQQVAGYDHHGYEQRIEPDADDLLGVLEYQMTLQ